MKLPFPPTIARAAFTAYNQGGPPERAGLTWDGKPVPPFEAVGAAVQHKWTAAAAAAARAGADLALAMIEAGADPAKIRAELHGLLACPPWQAPAVTP